MRLAPIYSYRNNRHIAHKRNNRYSKWKNAKTDFIYNISQSMRHFSKTIRQKARFANPDNHSQNPGHFLRNHNEVTAIPHHATQANRLIKNQSICKTNFSDRLKHSQGTARCLVQCQ